MAYRLPRQLRARATPDQYASSLASSSIAGMHEGYGGHNRRRKRLLRVAPLGRSQSLDAVSNTTPLSPGKRSRGGSASSGGIENRGLTNNLRTGPQHLPPLGRKDRRPSAVVTQTLQLSTGKNSKQNVLGDSPFPNRSPDHADWSSAGSAVLPVPQWTAFSDVFVQAGQAAGIAFQWTTEQDPIYPATPHEPGGAANVEGLVVVGVAEDSLAARHGGVSPGMMLVEVSGQRITGMSQAEVTHLMWKVASQSRVLTLARVEAPASPPSARLRPVDHGTDSSKTNEARQGSIAHTPEGTERSAPLFSSAALGLAGEGGMELAPRSVACFRSSSSSEPSQVHSRPHSSSLSLVGNRDGDASAVGSTGSVAFSSPFYTVRGERQASSPGPPTSSTSCYTSKHDRLPSSSLPQRLIALRFVGSRGNMTLFDRDHVLGLRTRDIEFVPPNHHTGGGGPLTLQTAAKHHRENSRRSLQDLTRDWKNDPFSTPARRRRLINDVCKVIVRSYTHAAAGRVAELRREEKLTTRIQAAFRMRSARRLFLEKLAGRRVKAASVLQLGWLSCTARARATVLREERDRDRRLEEAKRKRREASDRQARQRREEAERQRETERREGESKRRRERDSVVFLQRRFRARHEERRRLVQQAEQLREEERNQRAAALIQAAFRRRRRRREAHAQHQRTRGKTVKENTASARLQRVWRRHRAGQVLDRRRRRENGVPARSSLAVDGHPRKELSVGGHYPSAMGGGSLNNVEGDNHGPTGDREAFTNNEGGESWRSWSSAFGVNPALAAEMSREGEETAGEIARPWTAAGVVEPSSAAAKPSRAHPSHPQPPAGMMTVTVRRGSEETSLVTPIVLTENGENEEGAAAALSPAEAPPVTSGEMSAARPNDDSNGGETGPLAVPPTEAEDGAGAKGSSAVDDGGRPTATGAHTNKQPVEERGAARRGRESRLSVGSADVMAPPANTRTSSSEQSIHTDEATAVSNSLSLSPPTKVVTATYGAEKMLATDQVATGATIVPVTNLGTSQHSQHGRLAAGATHIASSGQHASRTAVKPTEQLFMEDTQVYLGCSTCGVKYLVEAVDPERSKSTQGQPAPEILYLCTTCGEALRNNGEDGRWRRRRRPSSAPAAGRRRGGTGVFGGGGGGVRDNSGKKLDGKGPAPAGVPPESLSSPRQSPRVHGEGRRGGGDASRLRYAHCARVIQHAYQDFRHRQYLRDWALSLLRRWLARRMHVWRRAKRRLVRRLAAVAVQSAVRAASARARCSALRTARLHLWMDRAMALLSVDAPGIGGGGDDGYRYAPSPAAVELLRDNNTTPPPSPLRPADPPQIPSPQRSAATDSTPAPLPAAGNGSVGIRSDARRGGRALAEALAPRMGRPPPGCPAALEVDWGEWGVGLRLVFPPPPPPPPSPRVG